MSATRCTSCGMLLARGAGARCEGCDGVICANCEVPLERGTDGPRLACFACCAPDDVLPVGVCLDVRGRRVLLGDPLLLETARALQEIAR